MARIAAEKLAATTAVKSISHISAMYTLIKEHARDKFFYEVLLIWRSEAQFIIFVAIAYTCLHLYSIYGLPVDLNAMKLGNVEL